MIGSRRRLGLVLAGACLALLAGWAFLIEPQRLQVRRLSLPLPGLQHPVKIFLFSVFKLSNVSNTCAID